MPWDPRYKASSVMSTLRALAVTKGYAILLGDAPSTWQLHGPSNDQAINPGTGSPDFTADQAVAYLRQQPDA
jgi:hypothetical protein